MPITVPTADAPTISLSPLPAVRQSSVVSPALLDAQATKQIELGNAVMGAGDKGLRAALEMQSQMDQIRVDDGVNKAYQARLNLTYDPEKGYLGRKGAAALTPDADGKALPDSYTEQLQKQIDDISAGLATENQRRMFALRANNIVTDFRGSAQQHMLTEYKNFAVSTQDGTIKIGGDTALANWQDNSIDGPRQQAIDSVKAAVAKRGQLTGEAASETVSKMKVAESGIHLGVVDSALQNGNSGYAMLYFDQHKGLMTADDVLKGQKALKHQTDAGLAITATGDALRENASKFAPTEFDRLAGLLGREVGKGENPDIIVKPLQGFVEKYGDAAKAVAAMYGGPEKVDEAVKKAEDAKTPAAWANYLPKDAQQYVAGKMNDLAAGVGAPKMPTELEFVNAAAAKLPATATPELVKLTRDQAERQYKLITADRKQRADQAESDAQQALIANGGDFAALDPQIKSNLSRLDPQAYSRVQTFAKSVGNVAETNMEAYAKATTYPEELAKMPDAQFQDFLHRNFTVADQKHVSDLRANILNGKTTESADTLNTGALKTALGERLASVGIEPKPKPSDTDGLARVGVIQKFVRDSILDQQKQIGRKMTPQEITDHVDGLFAKSVTFKRTLFGAETGQTSGKAMLTLTPSDLPSDTVSRIKTLYAARGVANPTDSDVMYAYWRWKSGR